MNFLIDAQLPPALAMRLREAGHAAVHVIEVLPGNALDIDLLNHAAAQNQVIISKDADFVQLAAQARLPVQLLWVRLGNCGNRALVDRLLAIFPDLLRGLESGAAVVELR
jgi:predicted nuclease of predicted toxin-antitoxin system